jgi:acyl-coenzyme A thioesterase PaaI-like protein
VSVLLDCQGNWAAAYALMTSRVTSTLPGTVTAEYTVKFLRPTPMKGPWVVTAWPVEVEGNRVKVEGQVEAMGSVTASMKGLFVAVRPDHPAFHRWE